MPINPKVSKLIPLIVAEVRAKESYVTKTKLLKLLYLFDVAYYRIHRETFTGFEWVYLKFGPWTDEYDELLRGLEANSAITITLGNNAEFFSTRERVEFEELVDTARDELLLKGVLRKWGEESTNTILDYVYFQTEPMLEGNRYEPLDFSTIPEELPVQYKRPASGKSDKQIEGLRSLLLAKLAELKAKPRLKKAEPIEYDDLFFEGMQAFEEAE
jgi:hypothetical protein